VTFDFPIQRAGAYPGRKAKHQLDTVVWRTAWDALCRYRIAIRIAIPAAAVWVCVTIAIESRGSRRFDVCLAAPYLDALQCQAATPELA